MSVVFLNEFEENLVLAIENISNNPTNANKNLLKNYLKNNLDKNKATVFEMFSGDRLTFEQQKILFDSIEVRQKCNIYNAISVESRERYLAYLVYTENNEYTVEGFNKFLSELNDTSNDAKLSTLISDLDSESNVRKLLSSIRSQAVADALVIEQNLLDGGMCTRDWSIEQIKEIYRFGKRGGLSSVAGTPHEFDYFGNPEYHITLTKTGEIKVYTNAMEGHHMLNVHDYPQFAGDGKNIQFLGKLGTCIEKVFVHRTRCA